MSAATAALPIGAYAQPPMLELFAPHSAASKAVYVAGQPLAASIGALPNASLLQGSDGKLYGPASAGGPQGCGSIFSLSSKGQTLVHGFDGSDGCSPNGRLVQTTDGVIYGTTIGMPLMAGSVFKLLPDGSAHSLHTFQRTDADGYLPMAGLLAATDGALYGSTSTGGVGAPGGTLFRITPSGQFTTIHRFAGNEGEGAKPLGELVEVDKILYGTTCFGGRFGRGTIFSMTASGKFSTIHSFSNEEGSCPAAALTPASDGLLYGTTAYGGASEFGTVFRVNLEGDLETLLEIIDPVSTTPLSALIEPSSGHFYGTTSGDSWPHAGTVFEMDRQGRMSIIHAFTFTTTDGAVPTGGLVVARDGRLYGVTSHGGQAGDLGLGVPYRITPRSRP